ncbi:Kinetochore protein Spc24 [Yamadazyma tenuis]|uniref:Kinetochore protein Spc24 n=1 Tax=Candida tenuis TaxID=2315449 RepID=UPI0027A3637A|nr:Kinetochore protein Spc24 [Yamadazyma tenuis]
MARKKSAAKKAKEAESKLKQQKNIGNEILSQDVSTQPKKPELELISDDDNEESTSEEEDEYGELFTADIDEGINKVLTAIRTDPSKLLDKDINFFEQKASSSKESTKKEKPMYLKDYHRETLLSGAYKDDEEEEDMPYGTVDGEKPFVVTQREERDQLLSDIKNAFDGDESEEESGDEFLKKKETNVEISPVRLPDPKKNEESFLKTFLESKAWIPSENDKVINLDRAGEDDEEFDEAADQFESAYNFRYEDPQSAEIVSYARTQATVRRDKTNARKRQREREQEAKAEELKKREEKIKRKETSKVNKALDNLTKIKEAVGGEVSDDVIQKVFGESLLNDDFDDTDWDSKMAEIFNEQYYDEENTKPEWSDMDDIGSDNSEEVEAEEPPTKKSKKDKLKDKKATKKGKESLKEKAKALVEANKARIIEEVEEEEQRGRPQVEDVKFKYREVSPESFGLTTRDILIADDQQLNSFIGIKKFAPYRPQELRVKDRRKYKKKKKMLEDWRKEVMKGYKPQTNEENDDKTIWVKVTESTSEKKSKKYKK